MKNDEEERRKPFRAGDCGHGAAGWVELSDAGVREEVGRDNKAAGRVRDSSVEDEATADRVLVEATRRPAQRRSWWRSLYRRIDQIGRGLAT